MTPVPIPGREVPSSTASETDVSSPISAKESISFSGFYGPLPPPGVLGQYEQLCPGSSDRIIRLAEDEALHRRSIEQSIARTEMEQAKRDSDEVRRGQICALIITLAAIGAGAYTAISGHEIAGSIIGVGGIGSIVTTFLLGKAQQEQAQQTTLPTQQIQDKKREQR